MTTHALAHIIEPIREGSARFRCIACGHRWETWRDDGFGDCPAPPMAPAQQKGDMPVLNTIQVGQIHRISHTEVFNADKAGVTQTLSITINAPRETVDAVLELAGQGAPVYVQVGTLQERMPLKAEKGEPDPPIADPKATATPRGKAPPKPEGEDPD